jgi:hypothetical protein
MLGGQDPVRSAEILVAEPSGRRPIGYSPELAHQTGLTSTAARRISRDQQRRQQPL